MKAPLVHCLTNAITAPFVADCIAAVGGRPVMAEDPRECSVLATEADALVVNLGQFGPEKAEAILAALSARRHRPWTLDPVAVGVFPLRLAFANQLLTTYKPTQIRGNASEVLSLATGRRSGSGTDSTLPELKTIHMLRQRLGAPEICVTQASKVPGRRDVCLKGEQETWYAGGVPVMGHLAGFGCALSAVAATLGSANQALKLFGDAGRRAATADMGTFRAAFVSALTHLYRAERARAAMRLYFVAGPQDLAGAPDNLSRVLADALVGGITAFQFRPKNIAPSAAMDLGRILRRQCAAAGVPFLVNDDLAMALALESDGLHLGQEDGDISMARATLGPHAIIGLSVGTPDHWDAYDANCIDYVGLGPYADTLTKRDHRPALGQGGLKQLRCLNPQVPSVAIGGLGHKNICQALSTGVDGVAVISALTSTDQVANQTQRLSTLIGSHFLNAELK